MSKNNRLLIIGSGSGGLPIASMLKKHNADYDITIFTRDTDIAYSPCGIPFVLGGEIASFDDLHLEEMKHYTKMGIDIRTGVEVTRLDTDNNRIFIGAKEVAYDYLVIATGTIQEYHAIEGAGFPGVFPAHLKTLEAARELDEFIKSYKVERAAVLGSDSIDLEMALAFSRKGIKTTVIKSGTHILPDWLDIDMADVLRKHLEGLGLRIMTGKRAKRIKGDKKGEKVTSIVFGDETIKTDIVLIGTSFKPDVRLAAEDSVEVSEKGIVIDEACRVKKGERILSNVFASGACAWSINAVTGKPDFFFRASSSIKKSKVVAERLLGLAGILKPQVNPRVTVLGGLHVGSVGINSEEALSCGIKVIAGAAEDTSTSRYFPGMKPVNMKLLFEQGSKRLIGGQVISPERGVKERIDALGMAICCGLSFEDLSGFETSYSPPVAHLTDVMTEASENIRNV
ncbi:MAG: FAD-dependent oxidoreductase [Candidatus Methanoperedens sp.]